MSELVQKWVAERTGLILDSQLQQFAENASDGVLMAKILFSYGIINLDAFSCIIPTRVSHMALQNWKKIRFWLDQINVDLNEEQMRDICSGGGSAALKLFYEIYSVTQGKDNLNYAVMKQKEKQFHVDRTFSLPTELEDLPTDNTMSIPLVDGAEIVKLHKDRLAALSEKCQKMRHIYNHKLFLPQKRLKKTSSTKPIQESITPPDKELERGFSYKELCKMQQEAEDIPQLQPDPQRSLIIFNKIKAKRKEMAREKELMTKMQKHLLLNLWKRLLQDQHAIFENCVSKKLLKQSMYEKQMANKIFHIRRQKGAVMEHRKVLQAEVQKHRDEELLEDMCLGQKRLDDEKMKYYQEKERLLGLHRKLYEQKMTVRAERLLKENGELVNDLVDFALKVAEYKEEQGEEPSRRLVNQWTTLFLKQQPIFDLYEPVEDIAVTEEADLPEDMEEIFCLEVHRQDQMDQQELEDYLKLNYPWDLKEETILIRLGCNVLGHIIHRLLRSKYPKPEPSPPSLPSMKTAVCLNQLSNLEILPILQQLLKGKKIKVFQMPEAVDFCIEAYKQELTTEYVESHICEDSQQGVQEKKAKKKEKPQKAKKGKKGKQKRVSKVSDKVLEMLKMEKATQSPRIFPGEEIKLTAKAELGRQAFELLSSGELITDSLASTIAVEYLKSFKEEIEGWVLINFPHTLQQGVQLEQALTFKLPDIKNLNNGDHLSELGDFEVKSSETIEDHRAHSFLLPDPSDFNAKPIHKTYLTAFISMKCQDEETNRLTEFYANQGCGFEFICEQFDLAAIKSLARLIIGDSAEPRKTSVELFGDSVNYLADERIQIKKVIVSKKGEKKKKEPKKVVKEKEPVQIKESKQKKEGKKTKDKKGAKNKKSKLPDIVKEDKGTQSPEPDSEDEEVIYVEPEPEPRPGEPNWIYHDLTLPEQFQVILAKLWENVEEIYISDFKQLFFLKRLVLNAVSTYIAYARTHVKTFMERPDEKQTYLQDFQCIYNQLYEDMCADGGVKAELHCRIAEFRHKLHRICDNRMEENKLLRDSLIGDNWGSTQLQHLCCIYKDAMQLELDRCVDTLRLLTDYYSAMIMKSSTEGVVLEKILLDNSNDENQNDFNMIKEENNSNPYDTFIINSHQSAVAGMAQWEASAMSALDRMSAMFRPKEYGIGKTKTGMKGISTFSEPDEDAKSAALNLLKEWRCAVEGEIERSLFRLNLQKERGLIDIQDCFRSLKNGFYRIFEDVRERQEREIGSVDKACEVLQRAVEAEVSLQPQLILEGDNFFIDPNTALFPDSLPSLELVQPEERDDIFTISQLKSLIGIFSSLAPNGTIPERHFIYIINDLITQENSLKVPKLWKRLAPQRIDRLSDHLFGKVELIDWRDFVIFNLNLPYPNEEELMETRSRFMENDPDSTETVKDYQFYSLRLWFEDKFDQTNPSQLKRMWGIKKLLCSLFKIDQETVNYTALLLKFCRDLDPVAGFAKALQLCLGRYVCWQKEFGDAYVEKIRSSRLERERFCKEAMDTCNEVITKAIDKVVHVCDSVVIEEYVSEETENKQRKSNSNNKIKPKKSNNKIKSKQRIYNNNSKQEQAILGEVAEPFFPEREDETSLKVLLEGRTSSLESYQPKSFDINQESIEDKKKTTPDLLESKSEVPEVPKHVSTAYFLPFDALVTVMANTMPWHSIAQTFDDCSFRERIETIFDGLKREEFENKVLAHEFLNCGKFVGMLRSCRKFETRDVGKIVRRLVRRVSSCKINKL